MIKNNAIPNCRLKREKMEGKAVVKHRKERELEGKRWLFEV